MMIARFLLFGGAALLVGAAQPATSDPGASDFAADARSIERRVNEDYGYLERFTDRRMPMTANPSWDVMSELWILSAHPGAQHRRGWRACQC